jgi:hypothetical protein
MEMNYYLFASYLFVLICVLVIVCKYLFADVKRQRRMLDEKEKQLLDTFRTLEDAMDDYYALVEQAKGELASKSRELENRLFLTDIEPQQEQLPDIDTVQLSKAAKKAVTKKPVKMPVSKPEPTDENQLAFDQLFTNAISNVSVKTKLHDKVADMTKQGRSRAEIAKTLKITQNEVELIMGMSSRAAEMPHTEEMSESI